MQIKAFCPKFGLSAPGAAEGQVQLWVRSWDAQPRVLGFSPVSHGPPGSVGAWERRVHEENWAQSSPQVREGWVWLWGLAAVGSQAQGKDSAATSSHSPPCSGCSSFSSLPPSLSLLCNVGVGWQSWESSILESPRSLQGSSLVGNSLCPWLLWERGGNEVLEKGQG